MFSDKTFKWSVKCSRPCEKQGNEKEFRTLVEKIDKNVSIWEEGKRKKEKNRSIGMSLMIILKIPSEKAKESEN